VTGVHSGAFTLPFIPVYALAKIDGESYSYLPITTPDGFPVLQVQP